MRISYRQLAGLVALLGVVASLGCATARPGDDLVLLRAEDLRIQSRVLYDHVMSWHDTHSTEETPAAYRTLETVRLGFPSVHKPYVDVVKAYRSAKARDPQQLRAATLKFLDDVAALGDDSWKAKVQVLRTAFNGGA